MGYTATEGLILTGQGSTNDVTVKNDADADVIKVPTGTTNVDIVGALTASNLSGTNTGDEAAASTTVAGVVELATIAETNTGTDTSRAVTPDGLSGATRTIFLSAAGGTPTTTGGCAAVVQVEAATNDVDYWVLDYDASTDESAFWQFVMPDSYDGGTITATFYWTAASGSGNVVWGCQGLSFADSDAIDTAYGTAQTVTDGLLTAADVHISSATSAITLAGGPAGGELVNIKVYRDADNGSDTLAVDARLIGVRLEYTIDAYSD
jgi:hypothetical protein